MVLEASLPEARRTSKLVSVGAVLDVKVALPKEGCQSAPAHPESDAEGKLGRETDVMRRNTYWEVVVLVVLSLAGAAGCAQKTEEAKPTVSSTTESFGRLTIDELEVKMKEAKEGKLALFIYDNNDKERYSKGHIPGATWVKPDAVNASVLPTDKDAMLVFYCANEQCSACHDGASAALKLGYKKVYILPSGIKGWEKSGKSMESV
jgi:rhodanese-related sulfurtransferase